MGCRVRRGEAREKAGPQSRAVAVGMESYPVTEERGLLQVAKVREGVWEEDLDMEGGGCQREDTP